MRHDELYVADLVDSTRAVREYLDGISREHWDEDRVLRDAVLYRLLLLGEIASALPDALRDRYPDVAWRQIRAFRNLAVYPGPEGTGRVRHQRGRGADHRQPSSLGALCRVASPARGTEQAPPSVRSKDFDDPERAVVLRPEPAPSLHLLGAPSIAVAWGVILAV